MSEIMRRTRLLIAQRFQIRYVISIVAFMFIVAFLAGYTVYVTAWLMMGEKLAAVYPQSFLLEIVNNVNTVLFLRLLCLCPLVMLVGLMLSSRIAGPMFRIKRHLNKMAGGHYEGVLKLRERDELKDIAEAVNMMAVKLRADSGKRRSEAEVFRRDLDELYADVCAGGREECECVISRMRLRLDKLVGV
ncbi:MAG TPA: HAMP domain-containing protein [Candidatus Omnitrophota bacterium]|nr:HAMP domain-containing protein [Candidatus Omnitrophota bacterium]HPS19934.1 HAMP domain-containing protein [Candidatus Omnitrophota bacterium]